MDRNMMKFKDFDHVKKACLDESIMEIKMCPSELVELNDRLCVEIEKGFEEFEIFDSSTRRLVLDSACGLLMCLDFKRTSKRDGDGVQGSSSAVAASRSGGVRSAGVVENTDE
ncbi:hypothetical protein BGX31_004985, partial [Mortierella sp. GBA43]